MDLGTTFVAAARSGQSQAEMVTLGDRSVVMPSSVYVGEDGNVITGFAADRRAGSSPDRVARQFKRRLGDPTPLRLGDASYPASELLAILLRDVLARVTETEGEPPEHVTLTHPANWGPFRRSVFAEVPRQVGLAETSTITEPGAAALHYARSRALPPGATIAVYDLGGGTFDATVIRKTPHGMETLGTPEGVERLGGVDFDEALFDHVSYSGNGAFEELDPRDPKTAVALARLRQDCVLAKESLSIDTDVVIPVFLPTRQFEVRITRGDFEDLIRARVESTVTALSRTLSSAKVTPDDLTAVLLVGGSSRIPLIARMVSEELGKPTLVDTHPKYAVALGAVALTAETPAATTTMTTTTTTKQSVVPATGRTAASVTSPAPVPSPAAWVPPLRQRPERRRRRFFTSRRRTLISVGVLAALLGLAGYHLVGDTADPVVLLRTDQPGEYPFGPNLVTSVGVAPPAGLDPDAREHPTGALDGLYFDASGRPSCNRGPLDALLRTDHQLAGDWGGVLGTDATAAPVYLAALTPARLRADTLVTAFSYRSGTPQPHPVVLQAGTAVLIDDRGLPAIDCANSNPLTAPATGPGPDIPTDPGQAWPGFSPGATVEIHPADAAVREFGLANAAGGTPFRRPAGTDGAVDIPQLPTTGRLEGRYALTGTMTRCRGFFSCQEDTGATFSMDATFSGCPHTCAMVTSGIRLPGQPGARVGLSNGVRLARVADTWQDALELTGRCTVRLRNGTQLDKGPHNAAGRITVTVTSSGVNAGFWRATGIKVDQEASAPALKNCLATDRAFSLTGGAQ